MHVHDNMICCGGGGLYPYFSHEANPLHNFSSSNCLCQFRLDLSPKVLGVRVYSPTAGATICRIKRLLKSSRMHIVGSWTIFLTFFAFEHQYSRSRWFKRLLHFGNRKKRQIIQLSANQQLEFFISSVFLCKSFVLCLSPRRDCVKWKRQLRTDCSADTIDKYLLGIWMSIHTPADLVRIF